MCMCALDQDCSSFAPGHAIHLIQLRLAAATPREWSDGLISDIDPTERTIVVRTFDGRSVTLWHSGIDQVALSIGHPVAVHQRYRVLAAGATRINVAVVSDDEA